MAICKMKDGIELYYRDMGEGEPVVLIHGWPANADMWENQELALLESGYRVINYDRRGFGRSGHSARDYNYDTFTSDLDTLLTQLGVGRVALVGFSMGGGEIARYLNRFGAAKVSRVALISSVVPGILESSENPDGVPAAKLEEIKAGLRGDRHKFLASFGKDFFGVSTLHHPVSAETLQWMAQMANLASLKATIDCVDAFGTTDFRADLAAFRVPTLIIHGDADQIVPIRASSERAVAMAPSADYVIYEGAPHGLFATHKERLNADLLKFLSSTLEMKRSA